MRSQLQFVILILLASCSTGTGDHSTAVSGDTTASVMIEDALSTEVTYIGYIHKFDDNNSFYTDLYFVDNFDYDRHGDIKNLGESEVFQGEETKRTKISIEKAKPYFDLAGLDNIDIYSNDNVKLTTGRLSHVEYVEDVIESYFVAVFDVEDPAIIGFSFCVGNSTRELTRTNVSEFKDQQLAARLLEYLNSKPSQVWGIKHYRIGDKKIYSTVSTDTASYLIETAEDQHRKLYRSENEMITRLTVTSRYINGMPVLLAECGAPETDFMWTSVFSFNGTEYKPMKGGRISREEHLQSE